MEGFRGLREGFRVVELLQVRLGREFPNHDFLCCDYGRVPSAKIP